MKIVYYIILVLSILSIVFNATKLNFANLLVGESQVAVISIVAALCVSVLSGIMLISLKINEQQEG
ncbi:hypothetical protein BST97_14350 [Nonlabens spongiae]|uniref:Uncharacterized protein n=1 Tax=Nonlabens spongiae TaxID=331648 RepID=A0A1W6MNA0_9FLAO|nr:hypothetical protein [Nonlabens spongiae]ARN79075.1 hypothetical protein BST97_14350 [Nonlabens spongiae]